MKLAPSASIVLLVPVETTVGTLDVSQWARQTPHESLFIRESMWPLAAVDAISDNLGNPRAVHLRGKVVGVRDAGRLSSAAMDGVVVRALSFHLDITDPAAFLDTVEGLRYVRPSWPEQTMPLYETQTGLHGLEALLGTSLLDNRAVMMAHVHFAEPPEGPDRATRYKLVNVDGSRMAPPSADWVSRYLGRHGYDRWDRPDGSWYGFSHYSMIAATWGASKPWFKGVFEGVYAALGRILVWRQGWLRRHEQRLFDGVATREEYRRFASGYGFLDPTDQDQGRELFLAWQAAFDDAYQLRARVERAWEILDGASTDDRMEGAKSDHVV